MKKVRIMLIAIAVFALGGGVLAFKAKTFGGTRYCVTANLASPFCPVFVPNASFGIVGATTYKYTTTSGEGCTLFTPCDTIGRLNP